MKRLGWPPDRHAVMRVLLCALPFAMLSWLLPFVSERTIGNDYGAYSILAQLDMMWAAWRGTLPLYMPGFAGGHSTAAMTLGQLFHPISWLSSLMPGYARGLALEWNTLFRLLELGLAHCVLFGLCRRLGVAPLTALLATFPAIYNLRMLDSFRYGASLEGYAGMLLTACAAAFVYLARRPRRAVVALAASTYLLAVSGHPQWTFLGLLGAGLFSVLVPWLLPAVGEGVPGRSRRRLARYALHLALGFGTGLLLASPYVLTFYFEYLSNNQARAERSYRWTLEAGDTLRGELANLFSPLHSNVHGAFGGSALFALALALPCAVLTKRRPPWVLWVLYGAWLFALVFAIGRASPLHAFVVQHVPLFAAFRGPGRILLWAPLLIVPILAWLLRPENRAALLAAGVGALGLFASNIYSASSWLPAREHRTPHHILQSAIPPYFDQLIFWLSGATLLLLAGSALLKRTASGWRGFALLTAVATTWLCLSSGTWQAAKEPTPTFKELAASRQSSPDSEAPAGYGMESRRMTAYATRKLSATRELGTLEHHVAVVDSDEDALKRLQRDKRSRRRRRVSLPLLVDRELGRITTERGTAADEVKLRYNTSNRFVFDVVAETDAYFVLGQAWMPGFAAKLDGKAAQVAVANALFPTVFVPRGTHRLELRFVSWPFLLGVGLAWVAVLGWTACVVRPRWRSWIAIGLASALAAAGLNAALYHGPSFATRFHWPNGSP